MRKLLLLMLLLPFIGWAQTETWTKKASLMDDISSRYGSQMVSYNGKLYFFGGYVLGGSNKNDFWEYDPATKIFTRMPNIQGESLNGGIGVVANNKLYFGPILNGPSWMEYDFATRAFTTKATLPCGLSGGRFVLNDTIFIVGSNKELYSYNIVTNSWTRKADNPGLARNKSVSFTLGGKGYFGGGSQNGGGSLSDFYEYDATTNIWTSKAFLPAALTDAVSTSSNGKGYIGTGYAGATGGSPTAAWYEYNPATNVWATKANSTDLLIASTAATVGNEVFLFGGRPGNYNGEVSSVSRYNVLTNTWVKDTAFAGGNRKGTNAIPYNGKIYFAGGDEGTPRYDVRAYDIATDSWTRKNDMPSSYNSRAQAIINNKLYIVGGSDNHVSSSTSQLLEYNPATDTWVVKAPYPGGAGRSMAAVAIRNYLYAGLGSNAASGNNASYAFYKYDPSSNIWTAVASCPSAGGTIPASSFAIADTAYVVFEGGSMYAYNTITNTWAAKAPAPTAYFEGGSGVSVVRAFTLNGKGYLTGLNGGTGQTVLLEYDPALNKWVYKSNWPGGHLGHTAVVVGTDVYMGFGAYSDETTIGLHESNQIWKLNFAPPIYTGVGDFARSGYYLTGGQTQTFFDSVGNLMGSVTSKGGISSLSIQARRLHPDAPYREKFGWYGGDRKVNGMFLNRNIFLAGNGSGADTTTTRLYFLQTEIDSVLAKFNRKFNVSYTVDSFKVVQFPITTDLDPLNNFTEDMNNSSFPKLWPTTTGVYQNGRYLEVKHTGGGELYFVLTYLKPSPTTITWTGAAGDSLFYNGNNWLPVKIPEATDTVLIAAGTQAAWKYKNSAPLIVGDGTSNYGNPNIRELVIDGSLTLSDAGFITKAYGVNGKLRVNAGGSFKTAGDIYADTKNSTQPGLLSIYNKGVIDAPYIQSNYGWLRMENGSFKNGYLQNTYGRIELLNTSLINISNFYNNNGSTTIIDTLIVNNTNKDFYFAGSSLALSYPFYVNLQSTNSYLKLEWPGKPKLNGNIFINSNDATKGLNFFNLDTLTYTGNITYANKGGLEIYRALVLDGNLIHNGVGDTSLQATLVSNVVYNGVTQFKGYSLANNPLIIAGSGNSQVKWPIGLSMGGFLVNKTNPASTVTFYSPINNTQGFMRIKSGELIVKPVPGVSNTVVVSSGSLVVESAGKLTIQQ